MAYSIEQHISKKRLARDRTSSGENVYSRFHKFLSDTAIDDLLRVTMGYEESCDSINAVYEWVKQNASLADQNKFDEIFSSILKENGTLWFNLGWHILRNFKKTKFFRK